jgi:hypothetical protein
MTDRKCSDCENFSPKPEEKLLPVKWRESVHGAKIVNCRGFDCGGVAKLHGDGWSWYVSGTGGINHRGEAPTKKLAQTAVEEALEVGS